VNGQAAVCVFTMMVFAIVGGGWNLPRLAAVPHGRRRRKRVRIGCTARSRPATMIEARVRGPPGKCEV